MKLRTKIIVGFFLMAGFVGIVSLLGLAGIHKIDDAFNNVQNETLPVHRVLQDLKHSSAEVVYLTKGALLRKVLQNKSAYANFSSLTNDKSELLGARHRLGLAIEFYRDLVEGKFQHEMDILESIEMATRGLLNASKATMLGLVEGGVDLEKLQRRLEVAGYVLNYRIDAAIEHEDEELAERTGVVESSITDSELTISLAMMITLLLAATGGGVAGRSIAGPVEALKEAVCKVATGGRGIKLQVKSRDELGELAHAFNSMSVEIESSQQALFEMHAYSESILRTMTHVLLVVREDGSVIRANEAFFRLSGMDNVGIGNLGIEDVLAIDWCLMVSQSGGGSSSYETVLHHIDGHEIPVLFSYSLHPTDIQDGREYICVAQDVSDLKEAEEEVVGAKRFLETVLNSMTDEICIIDPHDFRILGVNKSFADSYGLDPAAPLDVTCHKLTHDIDEPCSGDEDPCPIFTIMEHGKSVSCEHVHVCPGGGTKHVEIQGCPILDEKGEIIQIVHAARDITEKKEAEEMLNAFTREMEANNRVLMQQTMELEEAHTELKASQSRILQQEKMASIGQLAAGVAHEINNPMGFIISNLGSLQKYSGRLVDFINLQSEELARLSPGGQPPETLVRSRKEMKIDYLCEDLPELVEESLGGADRVKKIVQDLKSFSRVDQKEFKQVDLNEIIESTITIIWNELKYKVELFREFGELSRIGCFPQQLNQMFMNILVNAAQAMEDRGEIHVRTWQEGASVQVAISDNGCGIPEEVQNRIFEPFFTTKDVGKGTGLGMSIVYDIIKKHKGEVQLESEIGQGTTFTISLPIGLTEEMTGDEEEKKVLAVG